MSENEMTSNIKEPLTDNLITINLLHKVLTKATKEIRSLRLVNNDRVLPFAFNEVCESMIGEMSDMTPPPLPDDFEFDLNEFHRYVDDIKTSRAIKGKFENRYFTDSFYEIFENGKIDNRLQALFSIIFIINTLDLIKHEYINNMRDTLLNYYLMNFGNDELMLTYDDFNKDVLYGYDDVYLLNTKNISTINDVDELLCSYSGDTYIEIWDVFFNNEFYNAVEHIENNMKKELKHVVEMVEKQRELSYAGEAYYRDISKILDINISQVVSSKHIGLLIINMLDDKVYKDFFVTASMIGQLSEIYNEYDYNPFGGDEFDDDIFGMFYNNIKNRDIKIPNIVYNYEPCAGDITVGEFSIINNIRDTLIFIDSIIIHMLKTKIHDEKITKKLDEEIVDDLIRIIIEPVSKGTLVDEINKLKDLDVDEQVFNEESMDNINKYGDDILKAYGKYVLLFELDVLDIEVIERVLGKRVSTSFYNHCVETNITNNEV